MKTYLRYKAILILRYGFYGSIFSIYWQFFSHKYPIFLNLAVGFILGIMVGLSQVFLSDRYLQKYIVWKQILISILLFHLFTIVIIIIFSPIVKYFGIPPEESKSYAFISINFFTISVSGALILYFQVEKIIGKRKLVKYLFNGYRTPQKEDRIFMFLDLSNSTGLTEKMGNENYYHFFAEFVNDLSIPILESKAEIYQYVGDEIVFSWDLKSGIKNDNCVQIFYKIKKVVKEKEKSYLEKYNAVPAFKAAAHLGSVISAQVGNLKKEIIYCGDPLNTAARIEALCHKYNSELLVSDVLASHLGTKRFQFQSIGELKLRGKEELVKICNVSPI